VFLQMALVFALIGLLGLILRWTFGRPKDATQWPAESPTHAPLPVWPTLAEGMTGNPADAPAAATPEALRPARDAPAPPEDYGLLASVAAVDTADEASRVRALLSGAGIRATTTVGADGRHRVLVFASELHRARRVAGGP
jgi:cell division septation protein DedD